jgi:1-acyl-sn-glycerol-3-phosphate acyltransferase
MRRDPEPARSWTWPHYRAVQYGIPAFWRLYGGWRVDGQEHVPAEGGAVIAPNHISYFDPPAVGCSLKRRTYYMAKSELFKNPLFGGIIRRCYAFPVERGAADRTAIRQAIGVVQSGELLVVFPEGGRSPDGTLQEGDIGAALIAARGGVPIIPCALYGTDKALPRKAIFLHPHRVHVSFGAPITIEAESGERAGKRELQEATDKLMASIAAMQAWQRELYGLRP